MALELLQSVGATVLATPDIRAASATAVLYDKDGAQKQSVVATLDAVDTTVASVGSTPDVLNLASAAGVVVGREYWYRSAAGWAAKVRVVGVTGVQVQLETPPPGAPAAADLFQGLVFSAALSGSALATRGRHYRLDWTFAGGQSDRQIIHVVAAQFRPPATPDDAKRIAHQNFPDWARRQTFGTWLRLAETATNRVRMQLTADENYPDWIGDRDAFAYAGEIALRIELAKLGRVPAGYDAAAYVVDQEAWLAKAIRDAVAGVWVDRNENNRVDSLEVVNVRNTIIERV